ncbi:hypothetical protein SBV1_1240015 [Verrucomicrobia bacterium]|nr:hypothetical protein SBV1_1240015 [Verrucomicrobiota bacterium]
MAGTRLWARTQGETSLEIESNQLLAVPPLPLPSPIFLHIYFFAKASVPLPAGYFYVN